MDEPSLFFAFAQGDSSANQYFSDSILRFDYGEHLVSLLEKNVQNPKFFILIAIVLTYFVEQHKDNPESNVMMGPLFSRLISLVFQVPVIMRDQIINILKDESSTNIGSAIFEMLNPYFNSDSSIDNICSCLSIMSKFISSINEQDVFTNEQYEDFFETISIFFIKNIDALNYVQISTILQYIISISTSHFFIDFNLLDQLSTIVLQLLEIDDKNEDVVNMKINSIKLLNKWVSFDNPDIDSRILPTIEEKVYQMMVYYSKNRSEYGDSILYMLFDHTTIYLNHKESIGEIYNQSFMMDVLIPSLVLSDSQIKEFFQNPSQYLCFIIGDSFSASGYLRMHGLKLIKAMIKKTGFDPSIWEFVDETKYIIEAKVFATIPIFKSCIMPTSIADDLCSILEQIIENAVSIDPESIRGQIEVDVEEYRDEISDILLAPTLMLALTNAKGNRPELMELAISSFVSSPDSSVVLKTTSLSLLKSVIERSKEFQCEDIPGFMESLLFSERVYGKQNVLEKMMEYSQDVVNVGEEMYDELLSDWSEMIDAENQTKYMDGLVLLASSLPISILKDKFNDCLEITASVLQEGVEDGIEIVDLLTEFLIRLPMIDESANELVTLLESIVSAHIEGEIDGHIQQLASIIILLTQKANLCKNETALTTAVQLIDSVVESDSSSSQFLLALAALVAEESGLVEDALTIIKATYEIAVPSAYVFASCLMVGASIDEIPEDIIQIFIEQSTKKKLHELSHRELRMWTYCLLQLARNGVEEAIGKLHESMSLLVAQIQRKNKKTQKENEMKATTENDDLDEWEIEDESYEEIDSFYIDSRISIAVEEVNILQQFVDVISSLDLEIDESLVSSIQAMLVE